MFVFFLVVGFVVGWVYYCIGKDVEGGNNLLFDEIYDFKKIVFKRMVFLVFVGMVVIYLFGGLVGCEGMVV